MFLLQTCDFLCYLIIYLLKAELWILCIFIKHLN
ncbi:hypothetical protein BRC2024_ULFKEANI_CDS_0222 [Acinetobacter phage vB_AbaM_Konradin-v2]